ncbi:MAG: ECF transporter S component [Clostridia bacterium]|nr:ECF transporter S component [Clostridia bacterium]
MHSKHIRKLVYSAMFCALVFTATWLSFPSPFGGNVNLGDSILLLGAWMLGGPWSIIACAAGAALTDILSGYALYAPATLIIKALMVLTAILSLKLFSKLPAIARTVLSATLAELVMVLGYFAYEGFFLYGFGASALNIPFNLIQGGVAIAIAVLLQTLLSHARLPKDLN